MSPLVYFICVLFFTELTYEKGGGFMPSSSLDSHPALLTGPGIVLFGRWTQAWPYL